MSRFGESIRQFGGVILSSAIILMVFAGLAVILDIPGTGGTEANEAPDMLSTDTVISASTGSTASGALEDLFTTIDLMDSTVTELQSEMEKGNLTSVQLTQMYADRIEAYDRELDLNSVIAINPDAFSEALEMDLERSGGLVRGPLHGIPVIVKANIDIKGMATSAGAKALEDMISDKDAFIVRKLKDAGAVILGQANMSEFAYATASSRSTLGGNVHNAYDTSRTPAGSSGGTAVAVTCNFAALGVGTDTGGSIRNPSSFANIYGMRPSKGLISVSGILPLKAFKDTAGPMARTAEDMAILLEAMAGTDPDDDYTVEANADWMAGDGYTDDLSKNGLVGTKIGYLSYSFGTEYSSPNEKVMPMLETAIANLEGAGAEIVDISDILTTGMIEELTSDINTDTFEYDVNKYLNEKGEAAKYKTVRDMLYSNADGTINMYLGNLTADYYELAGSFEDTPDPYTADVGGYKRTPCWEKALESRLKISKIMEENGIDAVMYLNFFDVAQTEDAYVEDDYNYANYDIAFSSKLGLPEISLPMGLSDTAGSAESAMPLGLSVFSAYGRDDKLIGIAYAYEKQAGETIRKMPDITPPLEDERLNAFLTGLTGEARELISKHGEDFGESADPLIAACEKAETVDLKDPYAVYDAAKELAEIYDTAVLETGE